MNARYLRDCERFTTLPVRECIGILYSEVIAAGLNFHPDHPRCASILQEKKQLIGRATRQLA